MSTSAEQRRANAQFSTGPKTTEGKVASSQNNFKHGLYSKQLVLPCESAADLDALKLDLRSEHQPANTTEEILVNEMAEHYWRIKRARLFESKTLNTSLDIPALNAAHRLMSSAERGFHKALKTLREMQKQRGFESQTFERNADSHSTADIRSADNGAATGADRKTRSQAFLKELAASGELTNHPFDQAVKKYVSNMEEAASGFESQNKQPAQNQQPIGAGSAATRSPQKQKGPDTRRHPAL
jgi:hypothetical protein